uniref:Ig-like domain-containing protein n=1 Tax=Xenopus tropicalis TaxID=8364 RepID=A0A803JV57_XENTR
QYILYRPICTKYTAQAQILLYICISSTASQVAPFQVYGLITQSVSLAPTEPLAQPVEEVSWHYISNGTRYRLADYRNQRLSIRHSQFSQRLDADNSGTRLWIRELRSEDTGSYTEAITLQGTAQTVDLSFTLTVYEPVPTPDIKMEKVQINPDWCNFTLHCSAPTNPSALSYSWMYRHKGRYQPYPNGTTIRVSLQPESWDGEYLCLVQTRLIRKMPLFPLRKSALLPGSQKILLVGTNYYSLLYVISSMGISKISMWKEIINRCF